MSNQVMKSAFVRFRELLEEGANKIHEACKLYVDVIDANPEVSHEWREEFPQVSSSTWTEFERIGRGLMDSRLLTTASGSAAGKIRKLSIKEQQKILDNPYIEMAKEDGDKVKVSVFKMDARQINQAFDSNHIRSTTEQIRFLKQQQKTKPVVTAKNIKPYEIKKRGEKIVINVVRECSINFEELMKDVYSG